MKTVSRILLSVITTIWILALILCALSAFSYLLLDNPEAKSVMLISAVPGFLGLLVFLVSKKFRVLTVESLPFIVWP